MTRDRRGQAWIRDSSEARPAWDPRYTANAETLLAVTIEPSVGRVDATHDDISEHVWGEVRVWEPTRRHVHTFTLAQDPQHLSEVALEFVPGERGCTMLLAHGGRTEASAAVRDKFGDWPVVLDRFAAPTESHG